VPSRIQKTALMMRPGELMMSDIPWAVAWYGERPCAWLTLDDAGTFQQMNKLQPLQAIYLTQRTTDRPFLSLILDSQRGWGRFLFNGLPKSASPQGVMPEGFELTAAPAEYMPAQLFVSDTVRWDNSPKK
jgi:hypothetical protein